MNSLLIVEPQSVEQQGALWLTNEGKDMIVDILELNGLCVSVINLSKLELSQSQATRASSRSGGDPPIRHRVTVFAVKCDLASNRIST